MSAADHGDFGLCLEISGPTALAAARSALDGATAEQLVVREGLRAVARTRLAPASVRFRPGRVGEVDLDLTGSELEVETVALLPQLPPAWRRVAIAGTITVTTRLVADGSDIGLDTAQAAVSVRLDEPEMLAAPLVMLLLARAYDLGGELAYQQAKASLVDAVRTGIAEATRRELAARRSVRVLTAPPAIRVGTATVAVTEVAVTTLDGSAKVLLALGGRSGSADAVSRSTLLRSSSTGDPVDVAAITVSNRGLLLDILRPALTAALGLPAEGLAPDVPLVCARPVPLPNLPLPTTLDVLIAGVDEDGRVLVVASLTARVPSDAMTIKATVTLPVTLSCAVTGSTATLTVTPGSPTVSSEPLVAWWVYASALATGGVALAALLELARRFAGSLVVDGAVTGLLRAALPPAVTVPIGLPPGLAGTTVRTTGLNQPDAPTGTLSGTAVLSPLCEHDLVVTLV